LFELDVDNRSVKVGAGMRLSDLNSRLADYGLFFPVDVSSDPMIGGMVATNTGGGRFLRFGDVRNNVLALTVVLNTPEAEVLELGSAVRKNNVGPDWKHIYIGTSGWYGLVTEITLNLEPTLKEQVAALVIPSGDSAMLTLLKYLETHVGPQLSAFEFMSKDAMDCAFAHVPSLKNPFANAEIPDTAVLIELSRSTQRAPWDTPLDDVLQAVLAEAWGLPDAPIADALFGPPQEIWALRHSISEGVKSAGPLIAFDLGFTRGKVIEFRKVMAAEISDRFPQIRICDFGHLGDGGLHFNLIKTDGKNTPEFEQDLRDYVIRRAVEEFGGSYSAEHGIGPKNIKYFQQYTQLSQPQLNSQSRLLRSPRL
jgi:FAD/FMN-containing dehydrogenase